MSHITAVITGAAATTGGIATQNLNNLRALFVLSKARGRRLEVLSLHESDADRPAFLPDWVAFRGFKGNKRSLACCLAVKGLVRGSKLMFFDHVALALPVLPYAMTRRVSTVI